MNPVDSRLPEYWAVPSKRQRRQLSETGHEAGEWLAEFSSGSRHHAAGDVEDPAFLFRRGVEATQRAVLVQGDTGIRSGQGWSSTWRLSTLQRRSTDEVSASAEKLFRDLKREANEEGFPEPSYEAAVKAQYMLESLEHRLLPSPAETYPTPDGEIAIDIRGGYRKGLLLLYERKGSVLMLLTIDGVHQRAYFDKPPRHVNGFLQDALHELISAAVPAA